MRAASGTDRPSSPCVDEELKRELLGARHYRGVQPRLFTKAMRHELSLMGGWLAGDASDGAPWGGVGYTFHLREDFGLELSVGFSQAGSKVARTLVERYPQPIDVYRNERPVRQYVGHLVWSLAYGKLRWMGGSISRFDFHVAAGAGVHDDELSRGLMGSFGLGGKLYLNPWLAMRFDVRDQIHAQHVLDDRRIVNDVLVLLGLSAFVPFGG